MESKFYILFICQHLLPVYSYIGKSEEPLDSVEFGRL